MPDLVEIGTSFSSFGRLVQDIDLTLIFKMAAAAILDFEVKMALIYKVCHPIVFLTPKLVGIDTKIAIFGHGFQEREIYQFSKMAVAAILKNLQFARKITGNE